MKKRYTVCELFAGVGGFRLGLENSGWRAIWSNQWEPGKKEQHAFNCYVSHFGQEGSINDDIEKVRDDIPEHDLLVGGFPCQDYSVATTKAYGIEGRKGVLWWHINHILQKKHPPYILLENVDRLLRSPAKQRGRDFGIILACLSMLGYTVEWRMINSADYGFPQRRRRTFIFATKDQNMIKALYGKGDSSEDIIESKGFFAQEFPVSKDVHSSLTDIIFDDIIKPNNLASLSKKFEFHFHNAGFMECGRVYTRKVIPIKTAIKPIRSILEKNVNAKYYISKKEISGNNGWKYCKGAKNEMRVTDKGFKYKYTEGAIPFPDNLETPSRTMLTGEGNMRPNRITHVIKDPNTNKLRILTPVEAERLNGFPDGWTDTGMPFRWRYFCMGNALVVGLIERMGKRLLKLIDKSLEGHSSIKPKLIIDIDKNRNNDNVLVKC